VLLVCQIPGLWVPSNAPLSVGSEMSVNRLAIFSTHEYDKEAFLLAMKERSQLVDAPRYELEFIDVQLNENTASMAAGYDAVCIFVNDICNADVVSILEKSGVRLILLRCAGFDNVDLKAAAAANIEVARVSSYSPESVAEHAVTLLLALTRNLITAVSRTTHRDFHLEGLNGYALHHKTVGLIGTGRVGANDIYTYADSREFGLGPTSTPRVSRPWRPCFAS